MVVPHVALEVVGVHLVDGAVDRQLLEVGADAIALGILVRERATQQHLVRRVPRARDHVRWREARLLDLGEEVVRVAVERQRAHLDARVVLLRPDLGQIEGIEPVFLGLVVRHDLEVQIPGRMLAPSDGLVEILPVNVGVGSGQPLGLLVREVLHALVRQEVPLHPEPLTRGVDQRVRVRAVAVHVAPGLRKPSLTHQVGDLVGGLRVVGPEVPLHRAVAQAVVGQALLGADEVGELHRIAHEEDRGVVPHHVEVALFGVELQREAPHITPRVR